MLNAQSISGFGLFSCCFILAGNAYGQKWAKCPDPHAPGLDIYKHYSGTIGNKKIALDLRFGFCGGSNYGGSSYYYDGKEGLNWIIIGEPDSFDVGITLTGQAYGNNNKLLQDVRDWEKDLDKNPKWKFRISGNKLIGKLQSKDGGINEDIDLTEDYSNSYPLDLVFYDDKRSKTDLISAKPSPGVNNADADFITQSIVKFFTGMDAGKVSWPDCLKEYKREITGHNNFMPVYNDNGFLVLEKEKGIMPGSFSYLCLDVHDKKKLTLKDIMKTDSSKLTAMLETTVRKKYNLDARKKLSTWFKQDKIPYTDNIMIADKGVNFCYDMSDLIPEKDYKDKFIFPDTSIKIFLSYEQLKGMLTEDFKKRIGI